MRQVQGVGMLYRPPAEDAIERRLNEADKPGQHIWTLTAAWLVSDPERQGDTILDAENLIALGGVGCFKCERQYSRKLAKMPCRGSISEVQPI